MSRVATEMPDRSVCDAWARWLALTRDRCHIHYRLEGRDLAEHLDVCLTSARDTAERIGHDVRDASPRRILEVGSSVGFNCLALARRYPGATVVGLEPDVEALQVGHAMAQRSRNVAFVNAIGERLPFRDGAFDLVVCHTVIEHVRDVAAVIAEMARVLAPHGAIHLEAPNYVWPREPHLDVWCVPWLGKTAIRLLARLQGKGRLVGYLDHLQLVTPRRLERLFREHHLSWENRARVKLHGVAAGGPGLVKAYWRLGDALRILHRLGVDGPIVDAAIALGMYPSVQYTIAHRRVGRPHPSRSES